MHTGPFGPSQQTAGPQPAPAHRVGVQGAAPQRFGFPASELPPEAPASEAGAPPLPEVAPPLLTPPAPVPPRPADGAPPAALEIPPRPPEFALLPDAIIPPVELPPLAFPAEPPLLNPPLPCVVAAPPSAAPPSFRLSVLTPLLQPIARTATRMRGDATDREFTTIRVSGGKGRSHLSGTT